MFLEFLCFFFFFFFGISGNGLYMRDLDLNFFFWLINRVLKTQFSSGRHVENMPNQM